MSKPKIMERLERHMDINAIRSINEEERTCELSFSSEEPVKRYFGSEILEHKQETVNLDRLNEVGCLLFNHKRDSVIGRVLNARLDGSRCLATVKFDDDDESERIYKKVLSGTLKGVSMGYQVNTWEEVAPNQKSNDGRFVGPASIAKRWMPYEISIVSVPADATVGIGREFEETEASNPLDVFERQLQINKNHIGGKEDV